MSQKGKNPSYSKPSIERLFQSLHGRKPAAFIWNEPCTAKTDALKKFTISNKGRISVAES